MGWRDAQRAVVLTFWRLHRLPVRHRGDTKRSEAPHWWVQCAACGHLSLATEAQMTGQEAVTCSGCGVSETREFLTPLAAACEVDAITLATKRRQTA